MPPIAPPDLTEEHPVWALTQPPLLDAPDPEPRTETSIEPQTEPNKTEFYGTEPGQPAASDFTWDRFRKPLSEWQEGLEAIYWPYSDEAWSVCTTEEWLYGRLHARLTTRFVRLATAPTEQEEREIHVICMLAKYLLIKREEMGQAHLSIYIEEALSDAIIRLTWGDVDFRE
ncbi:hypothetical protein C7212DRAFT_345396 [Tuber magnatum]|uniref:Uncharacterized protein n=1 Tax=Tuber magnatum TaxID=42249 RepID=A0A317SNW3_9PEZI|nr:hypothetical protein C7212DRAFT_345396 [Tuber magnatum]